MKPAKKLLIVSLTDARRDPRVYRQASFLRERFQVTVAGLCDPEIAGVAYHPIVHAPARHPLERAWRAGTLLAGHPGPFLSRFRVPVGTPPMPRCDIAIVNDAETLPLGFHLAQGAPVVFDAHEYYPRQFENSLFWRVFHQRHLVRICRAYIPLCAAMTTVCDGIADAYDKHFGVRPTVIHSGPEYHDISASPVLMERIRLIHHGCAAPGRNIEAMIEVMDLLDDRFSLDLMLVGTSAYATKLRAMCDSRRNVKWRDPVPMPSLSAEINAYDMGIFLVPPATYNLYHCLPNKFFEFIQARLGIAIGPSPEMARLVRQHELGVVAPDFTPAALAQQLNAVTADDISRFKRNAHSAAAMLNADIEMEKLQRLLNEILDR
jgi:hypothetical protein